MAKYEFEWDDEQAQAVQDVLMAKAESATEGRLFFSNVAQRIEVQKLVPPLPTGLGAVVETDTGVFVRRIQNDNRDRVWWLVPDGEWFETYKIGRLVKVHAEGVDL